MNFDELNKMIPYARYGKEKSLVMQLHDDVRLLLPGRHAEDTSPKGGDFCVVVRDSAFKSPWHQFTHTDLFIDVQRRKDADEPVDIVMNGYYYIVIGEDPDDQSHVTTAQENIMGHTAFKRTIQALAVAEHRRYHQYESKFGGRFLPFRFAAGIAEGLWTAADASDKQKRGRPGVEWLEKDFGTPKLTQQLMNG